MSSTWGNHIKLSIFGGSHTEAIGVVIDGLPAGETIDFDAILSQMARRAPGRDKSSTPRKESDTPHILSGLLDGVPPHVTADTGIDVFTHAVEALVSTEASDFSDAAAEKAIKLVRRHLLAAYRRPEDMEARQGMHNASCLAGMAFSNSGLGLNHGMAHALGARFHIPHGRANAILLPYVIAYNAKKPTKFAAFPKYKEYVADKRYAKLAQRCGLCNVGTDTYEAVDCLIAAIQKLMMDTERPLTIKACGVSEEEFLAKVDELSYKAFEDQCTTANPVYPLVSEIKEIYLQAYYGK